MLRISMFAAVLGLAACATEPVDELANETAGDGEVGKGDSAAAFDFFTADPDARACSFDARCGGFFVSRPNRDTTICGRGIQGERCYVDGLDWSSIALPASVAQGYEQMLRNGEPLILKGSITPHPADAGAMFSVTEVWLPRIPGGVAEGVAVLVKDNGVRCITAPCPSLTEYRVNSNRFAEITDIDLATTDELALDIGMSALHDDGVLVFGDRYYPTKGAKGRAANQFYTRAPSPQF
jgi:hypothetical protein